MSEASKSSSKFLLALEYLASASVSTFHAFNDAAGSYSPGAPYSILRHTRSWVYYRGSHTLVPITILGNRPLSNSRRITLQRRGWRTGIFGWTFGTWLGGTLGKEEINVTPENQGIELDPKTQAKYDREVSIFLQQHSIEKKHEVLEVDIVRIPVLAGDGYFRLLVYTSSSPNNPAAATPSFRIGSLSLRSAHPRGASLVTILPEILLRTVSLTLTTVAWTGFYTLFPFFKIAQMIPGTRTWSTWALNCAYRYVGGNDFIENLRQKYDLDAKRQKAETKVYRTVPFGSAGIRTVYDIDEDAKLGRGGFYFRR